MKTNRLPGSVTRAAAAIAVAMLFQPPQTEAAKPPPPRHVELKITGPIFSLPDHTADLDSDQCRETGLGSTSIGQRKTTLEMSALGLGTLQKAILLDFGANFATPGAPVTFSFWVTKNCQLLVVGEILSGQWPLLAGSPGPDLVVIIPAFTPWAYHRFGGGGAQCSGNPTLNQDVFITIRRNDVRTGDVCDCPFDYTDANENMIADDCE